MLQLCAAAIGISFTGFYSRHRQGRIELPPPQVHTERYSTQPRTDINVQCTQQTSTLHTVLSVNKVSGVLAQPGRLQFSTVRVHFCLDLQIGALRIYLKYLYCCQVQLSELPSTAEQLSVSGAPQNGSLLQCLATVCCYSVLHLDNPPARLRLMLSRLLFRFSSRQM